MSERRKCHYCSRPVSRLQSNWTLGLCGPHGNAEAQYWRSNWRVRVIESFDEYAAKRVRPVEETT